MAKNNMYEAPTLAIATLGEVVNKYHPGTHSFYINALLPLQSMGVIPTPIPNKPTNIANEEDTKAKIVTTTVTVGSSIALRLPKEHTRWYPTKFIPAGTRFLVSFTDGNIKEGKVVGRI